MKKVEFLKLSNEKEPVRDWLDGLDFRSQAKILSYIDRAASGGSKKNIKSLGDYIWEIKIDWGPGYRVYFTEIDGKIILLLCGGDKSSQSRDIKLAKEYRSTYVS